MLYKFLIDTFCLNSRYIDFNRGVTFFWKMKILTIVGARPQFIKVAAGSRALRKFNKEIIVHTGQHFDENMSKIFFDELDIPKPDYNLNISGGTHAVMTANMLTAISEVLVKEKPDAILLYGDTNSTLSGSLAAFYSSIPVFHIEAGTRLGTLNNPEEVNRIVTDRISTLRFAPTEIAYNNLIKENLKEGSYYVGNIMYDSFLYYGEKGYNLNGIIDFEDKIIELPEKYYYMTCHRQENTYDDKPLYEILYAMNSLDSKTIYPVHPRNQERAKRLCKENKFSNIILTKPVGYKESVYLTKNAIKIVTDSGGLQTEAFFAGTQCVFVFDRVAWPETMVDNRNQLAKPDHKDILEKLSKNQTIDETYKPFGDGHSAEKIVEIIHEYEEKKA